MKTGEKDKKTVNKIVSLKIVNKEKSDYFDPLLLSVNKNAHFTYIFNFSRPVRSQKTTHHGAVIYCKRCFTFFDNRPLKIKLKGQEELNQPKTI